MSGCSVRCQNCQNPETWDFDAGQEFTPEIKEKLFQALENEWVSGITFSGGHPLEAQNIPAVVSLVEEIKQRLPSKTIWLYTGLDLTIEDFQGHGPIGQVLRSCDVVVDGRYIDSKRDITLPFRGSSNQRIIDVRASLKAGEVVLWNGGDFNV